MKAKLPYMIAGALIFVVLGALYNLLMIALGWSGLFVIAVLGAFIGTRFNKKNSIKQFEEATEGFDWDSQSKH